MADLALHSILKADLVDDSRDGTKDNRDGTGKSRREQVLHSGRESFLHALSGMAPGMVLEMHLDSRPDLTIVSQSRVRIVLCIRAAGNESEQLQGRILSYFLALRPLLAGHLPVAEFAPITDTDDLRKFMTAQPPGHAISIRRRRQTLRLDQPLQGKVIGFETSRKQAPLIGAPLAPHLFPWIPSHDDWSSLINTMMARLEPCRIIIRLAVCRRLPGKSLARLNGVIEAADLFLAVNGEEKGTLKLQADLVRRLSLQQLARLDETAFKVGVFLMAARPVDGSIGNLLAKAITKLHSEQDGANLLQGGFELRRLPARNAMKHG